MNNLFEAFQELRTINEDVFTASPEGIEELKKFEDEDIVKDDLELVIDPEAETEEELQDSYIGKVILECTICQSKLYKNPEEVVINEDETLANEGEDCPYCQSTDGYKVIGQVAEYCAKCEPEVETEDDVTVDVEVKEANEEIEERFEKREDRIKDLIKHYNDMKVGSATDESATVSRMFDKIARESGLKYGEDFINPPYMEKIIIKLTDKKVKEANEEIEESISKSLKEEIEAITIETDKEKINVTSDSKEETVSNEEEMIEPVSQETEQKFKSENEEDTFEEVDIDEFDETEFDELGEKYLRNVYENIRSFRTTSGSVKGNNLKLEGIITFKSGKQGKTNFLFEGKTISKTGKLKFIGENKQFAKGNKSFTLTGKMNGKKLIAESLTYNYRARTNNGAPKRIYGTVNKAK